MELKRKHLNNFIKLWFVFVAIVIGYNLFFRERPDWKKIHYKRCIDTEMYSGIVRDKSLNRGGIGEIILHKDKPHQSIWIIYNYDAYNTIKKGDSLIKFASSDKVLVFRKDSVLKLSNYGSNDLKKIHNYDSWSISELNHWEKISSFK